MGRVLIQGVGLLSLCGRDGGMMGRVLMQSEVGIIFLCLFVLFVKKGIFTESPVTD